MQMICLQWNDGPRTHGCASQSKESLGYRGRRRCCQVLTPSWTGATDIVEPDEMLAEVRQKVFRLAGLDDPCVATTKWLRFLMKLWGRLRHYYQMMRQIHLDMEGLYFKEQYKATEPERVTNHDLSAWESLLWRWWAQLLASLRTRKVNQAFQSAGFIRRISYQSSWLVVWICTKIPWQGRLVNASFSQNTTLQLTRGEPYAAQAHVEDKRKEKWSRLLLLDVGVVKLLFQRFAKIAKPYRDYDC